MQHQVKHKLMFYAAWLNFYTSATYEQETSKPNRSFLPSTAITLSALVRVHLTKFLQNVPQSKQYYNIDTKHQQSIDIYTYIRDIQ